VRRDAAVLLAVVAAGCSHGDATPTSAGASAASAPPAVSSTASAAAPVPSAAPISTTWSGHYTATHGALFVPDGKEWAGVKFRGDDASTALGDGTLMLTIEPSGHARGTLDGALGSLAVEGVLKGDELTASLRPSDPATGFTGTAVGTRDAAKIAGTMRVSTPTGDVIRAASFALDQGK